MAATLAAVFIASLAKLAVFDCSLRSRRIAPFSRCLPHSLADERRVCSLVLSTAARDPVLDCLVRWRSLLAGLLRSLALAACRIASLAGARSIR
jgi:hypothetical protein